MDNITRDVAILDIDLNHEPLVPFTGSVLGLGSLSNELETTHDHQIEERIRQLEAVSARARQRQRWRQARNISEASPLLIETIGNNGSEGTMRNGDYSVALEEGTVERAKSCKRDRSHLVAKALELDADVNKKVVGEGRGFFDCNVCLYMAREPILTCCGHLFCWACFYLLPYVYSTAKECPVCKGEITDKNITPVYGNGNNIQMPESESGVNVPPRPQAHRIESIRLQRFNRGVSHIPVAEALQRIRAESFRQQRVNPGSHVPVAEALQRIRAGIGAMGEGSQQQDFDSVSLASNRTNFTGQIPTSEAPPNTRLGGSRRLYSHQFSRVLSETAASLASISSALDNPGLLEDLEFYIHNSLSERSIGLALPVDVGDSFAASAAMLQPQHQTVNSAAEINSEAPIASSSERADVSASDTHLEYLRPDAPTEMNLAEALPSSASRRRNRLSRVFDVDNGVSRAPRRRRLS